MIKLITVASMLLLLAERSPLEDFAMDRSELADAETFLEIFDVHYHFGPEWMLVSKPLAFAITGNAKITIHY